MSKHLRRWRVRWRNLGRLFAGAVLCFGVSLPHPAQAQPRAASPTQLAEVLRVWMSDYAGFGEAGLVEPLAEFRPGIIEQLQLRSEADRLDLGRQRYGVRVQPKLPHIRRAERDLQQAERTRLEDLGLSAGRDADEEALRQLFGLAAEAQEMRTIDSLIELQRGLVEVTFRRMAEPNYDVDRVLDAQDDLADLRLRRERLSRRAAARPSPLPLDRLVDVWDLPARIATLRTLGPQPLPASGKLAVLDAELALEKAQNNTWLDFLQVNYRSDLEVAKSRYSLGGGLEFPLRTSALPAVDKLRVERQQEQIERAVDLRVQERELTTALDKLSLALEQYGALLRSLEERKRNRIPLERVLASSPEAQPEDILRLRRRTLTDRLSLLDLAADIRDDYASLLAEHYRLDVEMIAAYVLAGD